MQSRYITLILCLLPLWLGAQFTLPSGVQMVADGAPVIVVESLDWDQDGSFTPGQSEVIFRGNASSIINSSASNLNFYQLTLDKSGGDLQLDRWIRVTNELTFSNGLLDLNNNYIELGLSGTLQNESETSHIYSSTGTGSIRMLNVSLVMPTQLNPGNLGLSLTDGSFIGSANIFRFPNPQTVGGTTSINRTFRLQPNGVIAPTSTMTARITYLDAELNGALETDLEAFSRTNGASYTPAGYTSRDPVSNYVEFDGIRIVNILSIWDFTLAEFSATSFPVEWLDFTATPEGQQVRCLWSTASEVNTDHFVVERSQDGASFEPVTSLPAAGNSQEAQQYEAWDDAPYMGQSYYRIRQVDLDGAVSWSPQVAVSFTPLANLSLSPNPASTQTTLEAQLFQKEILKIALTDLQGRIIWQQTHELPAGQHALPIALTDLSTGVYTLQIRLSQGMQSLRLVVE